MSPDIKRTKCQAFTAQSNYTVRCRNYSILNTKYCKLHSKRRKSRGLKSKEDELRSKKRSKKLWEKRSKSTRDNISDKQSRNSRFIISHGSTPTEPPDNYPNYKPIFKLPTGVRLVLFEVTGRSFEKLDAGYIYNWILRTIEENNSANIMNLDETILKIGIPGTKDYYCRVYDKPNTIVPNILYTAEDPVTQLGVFKFTKFNKNKRCVFAYCTFRNSNNTYWEPQWDISASDNDFNFELFGKSEILTNKYNFKYYKYDNIESDLYKVATYASKMAIKRGKTQTIYVISCRDFYSPSIENAIGLVPFHQQGLQNIQSLYSDMMREVGKVINKCDDKVNLSDKWKSAMKNIENQFRQKMKTTTSDSLNIMNSLERGYNNLVKLISYQLSADSLKNGRVVKLTQLIPKEHFWDTIIPIISSSDKILRSELQKKMASIKLRKRYTKLLKDKKYSKK